MAFSLLIVSRISLPPGNADVLEQQNSSYMLNKHSAHRLLIFLAGFSLAPSGHAQDLTTLHTFTGADGANPVAALIIVSNRLFGTTSEYYESKNGTVFVMNLDGSDFRTLHRFPPTALDQDLGFYTNSDGIMPMAGLVFSGNRLYGTTFQGGPFGSGTVFAMNTDGTSFTILHSFNAFDLSDGINPSAPLTLSGDTLYGTTYGDSTDQGFGTVFSIKTNGAAFTVLHRFNYDDGAWLINGLELADSTLYGMTRWGGTSQQGVVFKINTDGTGFTNLHSFVNSDGGNPAPGKLALSGSTLYGTTFTGGTRYAGTVFKLQTDGSGFSTLYNFDTNAGPAGPSTGVILDGNTLYGATITINWGNGSGSGALFSLGTDGTRFTTLHNFTAVSPWAPRGTNGDGGGPEGDLVLLGNRLYGTTFGGGAAGYGTIFSISVPPSLSLRAAAEKLVFAWSTNAASFKLQTSTNPSSPGSWSTVSQEPAVMNGQNTVTLSPDTNMMGQARFYRLIH